MKQFGRQVGDFFGGRDLAPRRARGPFRGPGIGWEPPPTRHADVDADEIVLEFSSSIWDADGEVALDLGWRYKHRVIGAIQREVRS